MPWQQTLLRQDAGFAAIVWDDHRHIIYFSARRGEVSLLALERLEGSGMTWSLPFDNLAPRPLGAWSAENGVVAAAQVLSATMQLTRQDDEVAVFQLLKLTKHPAKRSAPSHANDDDMHDLDEGHWEDNQPQPHRDLRNPES